MSPSRIPPTCRCRVRQRVISDAGKRCRAISAPTSWCWPSNRNRWDGVLPGLRGFADANAAFLSIAAGKTLTYFARHLGPLARVVRSMPNTPASVRQGITVAVAGPSVDLVQRQRCDSLLKAVGDVIWVEDEGLLDPVTAVSGSGPAYVFLLVEAMAAAGVKAGLRPTWRCALARATVAGSGELLRRSSEPAAQLRQNVTSPRHHRRGAEGADGG